MKRIAKTVVLMGALGPAALISHPYAQTASSIHVCIGVDRVVRFSTGTSCPSGQASYNLALDGTQPNPPDEDKTASSQISELKKNIEFLRDRVSNLEKESNKAETKQSNKPETKEPNKPGKNESSINHVIRAPFSVVDKNGRPILTVTEGIAREGIGRVRVGRGTADNYGIWIMNSTGTPMAALAEAKDGAGQISAYAKDGSRSVQAHGGDGFSLFSPSDKEIAKWGFRPDNQERGFFDLSGLLQIFNDGGETVVEAGTNPNNVGVVKVGPGAKCVPMATLRVPDCIMGRR